MSFGWWLFDTMVEPFLGRADDREPYFRDENGQAWAVVSVGEELSYAPGVFDTPQHEEVIHDGTGHGDPAVYEYPVWKKWLGFWPYRVMVQERNYGLTINDANPNLAAIQADIDEMNLRGGQQMYLTPVDDDVEDELIQVETANQRGRGVSRLRIDESRARG